MSQWTASSLRVGTGALLYSFKLQAVKLTAEAVTLQLQAVKPGALSTDFTICNAGAQCE